ncbi:MAG: apolipoprotein N-acyltransferase [Spirochaetaceae bacterium]|jgi:apolipoprotein N-acyltransferase|nr:apolipoprotein N-acyltransferase [Spirochaetaceae bacterium]
MYGNLIRPRKTALPHKDTPKSLLLSLLFKFSLVLAASLLYAFAFPNPLLPNGFAPAAFAAYLPLFFLICISNLREASFFGLVYGALSNSLFSYWLSAFHPLALPLVVCVKAFYNALFFAVLCGAGRLCKHNAALVQTLLWVGFEYLQSLGYLGYTYGFAGYSQWNNILLLQTASITGVWGISALVIFPQAWLVGCRLPVAGCRLPVCPDIPDKNLPTTHYSLPTTHYPLPTTHYPLPTTHYSLLTKTNLCAAIAYLLLLAVCLARGAFFRGEYASLPHKQIALVQQNDNPWKSSVADFRATLGTLLKLSDEALTEDGGNVPALVVWPETAFVPTIDWHIRYRTDPAYYELVKELTGYLAKNGFPFLIGNDDGRRDESAEGLVRVDYNAAVLFEQGEITGVYHKQRLVPFAEHFPYKKFFPRFYAFLQKAGFSFWEAGKEPKVFEAGGFRFSPLICFEDGFGYLARERTRMGAQVLVNMTNDSWGRSLPCQMQHLAMSVFRAVENRRSVVRAAASGQTCAIAPDGRIIKMAAPFTAAALSAAVPLTEAKTFYTKYGDWFPVLCLIIAAAALIAPFLAPFTARVKARIFRTL